MVNNNVTVAWATPVDAFALGAQMEAHVESKAPVHTFRLCVKYAQASGNLLGRLPPELVENVVAHIRQPILESFSAEWQRVARCCSAECSASDHIDSEDLAGMKRDFLIDTGRIVDLDCDSDGCASLFEEALVENGEGVEEHSETMESFLSMIEEEAGRNRNKRFAKCVKMFTQDFHLEVYFTVFREYDEDGPYWGCPVATVLAYLILPSIHSAMKTCSGPGTVSYLSSMIIDPSILREPSAKEKTFFKETLRTLQLIPWVHKNQLTTSSPTSQRLSKATDEQPSGAADRALAWTDLMKIRKDQAAELASLASSDWPKLMVLASGECEANPSDY